MKERSNIGAIVALTGALVGIVGVFAAFLLGYQPMIDMELAAGRPDEALIVQYVIPFLSDVGLVAGVLWAVAAYGFLTRQRWAWTTAVIANVLSLLTGFFGMIPAVSRGLFPTFLVVFLPNLITYLLLLAYVRSVDGAIIAISFFSGILTGRPLVIAVQRVNWVAAIGWAVFTVALLLRKAWAPRVGLGAALLTLVAGIPLAVVTTLSLGRFSLFSPAPMLSLALLILFLIPAGKRALERWLEGRPHTQPAAAGG
jgi:hypothetical protein